MSPDLRPARPDEAGALSDLALRSKAHWGYDTGFLDACRPDLTFGPDDLAARRATVAAEAGALAGFYTLDGSPPAGELGNLWIDPAFMRRGIGRALWNHAMATARTLHFTTVLIDADPNAEAFYTAMGAERVGAVPSSVIPGRLLPQLRFRP
ncbi:GNAT family N-acetyltransferase [Dactylosporangium sp. CA-139066]|uniref:GNAT family N-acetyltransferase n=1 Tax=Dactylosporangium sp. CA-139066 TaxID=3239930 RepID=UPI003D94DA91